ncbi:hypothetical protein FOA52_012227 [Chlamydomonas sp. UWO 241]|nr:hypothetical protein FOA52_012227 [Chlamydomonas sp. UWO 241]
MQHAQRISAAGRTASSRIGVRASTPLAARSFVQSQSQAEARRHVCSRAAAHEEAPTVVAAVQEDAPVEVPVAAAAAPVAAVVAEEHQEPSSSAKQLPVGDVWEIDFCSRPLVDERGKKVWELLICDPERKFEYTEYFSNSKINSAELKKAISRLLAMPGATKPDRVRFFRGQMQTIITKALVDLAIKPVPSRRCFTVMSWLEERLESVYKRDPRFNDKSLALFSLDLGAPEALPDALRGEKWAFVQLPLSAVLNMLKGVKDGEMFGATFPLDTAGVADLSKDMLIPGVAVFSRRALPLAAWTNGLDIAAVKADVDRSSLILETGINQRWSYGKWRPSPDSIEEAQNWEECKIGVKGIHFLAVQSDPDSDELNGLWLLQDRVPPAI